MEINEMANQEHLDILKQGVDAWNAWREQHPEVLPDFSVADLSKANLREVNFYGSYLYGSYFYVANLRNANLRGAYLSGAKLNWANLSGADLSWANLSQADLRGTTLVKTDLNNADLSGADLSGADLSRADLSQARFNRTRLIKATFAEANLSGADFSEADLGGAHLSRANLRGTILTNAKLNGANLRRAKAAGTTFGNIDLSRVKGLNAVNHNGPSTIGLDTISHSQGNIPEIFLRKAGVPDSIIEAIPSLIGSLRPIDFYSCFISYSDKDRAFAERLYDDLQSKGVRCWFAPEDLKWGEKIRTGIDEAIHLHDKLLLILSKHSVASGWVEHEVKSALAKERKEKRIVLFPIRLDKAIFDSPLAWATEIRHERNIGDFTGWKQHDDYQKALARLLSELNVKTIRRL